MEFWGFRGHLRLATSQGSWPQRTADQQFSLLDLSALEAEGLQPSWNRDVPMELGGYGFAEAGEGGGFAVDEECLLRRRLKSREPAEEFASTGMRR